MSVRLAIDCMGGDHGLAVTIPATLSFLESHPRATATLVGRRDEILAALGARGVDARLTIVHAEQVIGMDEAPAQALRNKRDSSMRVAIRLVKDGQADACISAGNTGALMAISRFVLKTLDGIDRPAIASPLPNEKGGITTMLDLGANVDCTPEHLLQFAILGAALVAALQEIERPSVGLLNIGEEAIKGNEVVKRTAELLRVSPLNFYGNVEGDDIYKGTTDVVVCDGFVGNVALKASEGVAHLMAAFIKQEFTRGPLSKLAAAVAMPVLKRFKDRVDPARLNGAALLGLRGIVIKSHGGASVRGFEAALQRGFDAADHCLLERTIAAMEPFREQLLGGVEPEAVTQP
ncbi:MAG: phosphate acyltransferase PlsX [Burkholderiaceae bacterium]